MTNGRLPELVSRVILSAHRRRPVFLFWFVLLFSAYWLFFPVLRPALGVPYALLMFFLTMTAAFLWGLKGGLLVIFGNYALRYSIAVYFGIGFEGGTMAPITGLVQVIVIGSLSDYVSFREIEMKRDEAALPVAPSEKQWSAPVDSTVLDLIAIGLVVSIMALASGYYDWFEWYYETTRQWEPFEFDELAVAAMALAFCFGVFSYRRWRESLLEMKRRVASYEELARSRERYGILVNNAHEGICVLQDGLVKYVNPYGLQATGYSEVELLDQPFVNLLHPEDREISLARHWARLGGEDPTQNFHIRLAAKNGEIIWMQVTGQLIQWEGRPATLNFLTDVTKLIQTENKLKNSLREKEALLKEVHHRVKNNMQVVASMLNLHRMKSGSAELKDAFAEAQNRIRAMSLVHEILYNDESLSVIDMERYIVKLCQTLRPAYDLGGNVRFEYDIEPVQLDLSQAVSCGIAINELVTNALKHGIKGQAGGIVRISAFQTESHEVVISICDNGDGLPEGYDPHQAESLGLKLVNLLTKVQLSGRVEYKKDGGACFTIAFEVRYRESEV